MTDFINGKITKSPKDTETQNTLFENPTAHNLLPTNPLKFSKEATVFNAGRELWKYYHSCPNAKPNASLYDIREYFQGRNEKAK